jgi:hypothetical protein
MARASMAGLITRLRRLIADPAGAGQVWTDDELQDALDARRQDARYLELAPAETIQPGGAVAYLDYYAPCGDWEDDEKLYHGSTWVELSPTSQDLIVGKWSFSAHQNPPVYLVGKAYDLYAAAANVLEAHAAKLKLKYDFASNGQQFQRSQQVSHLLSLAAQYRRRARAVLIPQVRGDVG